MASCPVVDQEPRGMLLTSHVSSVEMIHATREQMHQIPQYYEQADEREYIAIEEDGVIGNIVRGEFVCPTHP